MRISISGLHGTGKSTVAQKIARHFSYAHYSTGELFRTLAAEKGYTLEQFSKIAEKDKKIDLELDALIRKKAMEGNCVLDNQLSPYLLKDILDVSILLKCDFDERIHRMTSRDQSSFEQKKHETLVREDSEHKRFLDFYGIDLRDPGLILSTFHLIMDTTHLSIESVEKIVITFLEQYLTSNNE